MLDGHRALIASELPRRKFETELQITVGGLRADSGTYYTGRQRSVGVGKLSELQQAHKLGVVGGSHLISKRFDPTDPSRDEGTYVAVEARFTRPQWPQAMPGASVSLQLTGAFGNEHLDVLVDATWRTFQHLVDIAPVTTARAHWDQRRDDERSDPSGLPVHAFMLIDASNVAALGGAEAAAEHLEAFDWKSVRGDEQNGVVVQLGRRPEDITGDRLTRIRRLTP